MKAVRKCWCCIEVGCIYAGVLSAWDQGMQWPLKWCVVCVSWMLYVECGAVEVGTVRSKACEWQHNVDTTVQTCVSQKDRISCYPDTNCAGGVFYGVFLQDWLAKCPGLSVVEYNKECGTYLKSGGMSTGTITMVITVSVLGGVVVIGLGILLVLFVTRSKRTGVSGANNPYTQSCFAPGYRMGGCGPGVYGASGAGYGPGMYVTPGGGGWMGA